MVERNLGERQRLVAAFGEKVLPERRGLEPVEARLGIEVGEDDRPFQCRHGLLELSHDVDAIVVATAVAVAVDGQEHARLDLCEPVDHASYAEIR